MHTSAVTIASSCPRRMAAASTASRYRTPRPAAGAVDCSSAITAVAAAISSTISPPAATSSRRLRGRSLNGFRERPGTGMNLRCRYATARWRHRAGLDEHATRALSENGLQRPAEAAP